MSHKQSGFSNLALVAAAATVGFATMVVQKNSQDVRLQKDLAQHERGRDKAEELALNAISRYRSLMNMGSDKPAVFPLNYFDQANNWKLTKNSDLSNSAGISANDRTVTLSMATMGNESVDTTAVMNGVSALNRNMSDINVRLLSLKDDGGGYFQESADVQVTGQFNNGSERQRVDMKFRVPLPPPRSSDPVLKYRLKGSGAPYQVVPSDLSNLAPGTYQFRAYASGIALGARIYVDGETREDGVSTSKELLGVVGNAVTHGAVNYNARDVPIGEAVEVNLNSTTETLNVVGNSEMECRVQSTMSGGPATGPYKVQMEVIEANGDTKKTEEVVVGTPRESASISGILTEADNINHCNAECPYQGGTVEDSGVDINLALYNWPSGAPKKDLSSIWTIRAARILELKSRKLCVDMRPAPEWGRKDWDPYWSWDLIHDYGTFYTYTVPACKREFLMKREVCGCLSEDSVILLGDGKTEKRIDQLVETDTVWNPLAKRAYPIRLVTKGPEKVPMLNLKVGDRMLKATGNHPFPTPEGMKTAFALEVGDKIQVQGEGWVKIESIEVLQHEAGKEPIVWNVEVEAPDSDLTAHHFVANGILTGDLYIQKKMQGEALSAKAP